MIGYITVGTNNIEKSVLFYDEVFKLLGADKVYDYPTFVGWKFRSSNQMFAVTRPYDGKEATIGNGTMIALNVGSPDKVHSAHEIATKLGGTCEGAPGQREGGFYCGYVRDLDGNKLNFYVV